MNHFLELVVGPWLTTVPDVLAHLVSTGLGPFYDGASHVFLSPESLLALIAVALLGGLSGVVCGRVTLEVGAIAWIAGVLAGYYIGWDIDLIYLTLVPLALGILVMTGWQFGPWIIGVTSAVVALIIGISNGSSLAEDSLGLSAPLGAVVAAVVLLAIVSAGAGSARARWSRTVVRVLGSWIAAISLLLIGWEWKKGSGVGAAPQIDGVRVGLVERRSDAMRLDKTASAIDCGLGTCNH